MILGTALLLATHFSLSYGFVRSGSSSTLVHTRLHATWSDAKAVKEYQDFLKSGSQELEKAADGPSVVVKPAEGGDEELANALLAMGMGDDVVLRPGEELPSKMPDDREEYPIYITVPPTELESFLKNLPDSFKERREDFVFISGGLKYGNIEDVLKTRGYCRDTMTQFLCTGIKFSLVRPQDQSVNLGLDAQGQEKWAGECAACGKWMGAVEQRLERAAIRCKTGFYREWRRLMWERNIYDAVFNIVGAVREEPTTIGDVALYYGEEASDMVWGISSVLRGGRALTMTYGFEERLFGVAEANGGEEQCKLVGADMYPFIYEPFELASGLVTYLHYAKDECGLLTDVSLPPQRTDEKAKIRQGNLRADGVI